MDIFESNKCRPTSPRISAFIVGGMNPQGMSTGPSYMKRWKTNVSHDLLVKFLPWHNILSISDMSNTLELNK